MKRDVISIADLTTPEIVALLDVAARVKAEHKAGKVNTALADLLNGDGNVDPDKVAHRASQVRDEFGLYPPNRKQNYVPREGGNPQAGRGSARDQMINAVMVFHE